MKKTLLFLLLIAFFSCRTKTVILEKNTENKDSIFKKKIDSILEVNHKKAFDFNKNSHFVQSDFHLKSTPIFDSLGNAKPMIYKHFINGVVVEEIHLEGGELTKSSKKKHKTETVEKLEEITEKTTLKKEIDAKVTLKKDESKKDKKVEPASSCWYLWLFALIVAAVIGWNFRKKLRQ